MGEIFCTSPNWPGGLPSFLYSGYRAFPRLQRQGRSTDHPPPSNAEVKERVELYLYSTCGPSCPVTGSTLPLPSHYETNFCYFSTLSCSYCLRQGVTFVQQSAIWSEIHTQGAHFPKHMCPLLTSIEFWLHNSEGQTDMWNENTIF